MSDTEMLEWLLEKICNGGLDMAERHEWFLKGEKVSNEYLPNLPNAQFEALKKSGELELRHTGYHLLTELGVEWSTYAGEGETIREAIKDSIAKEKAG